MPSKLLAVVGATGTGKSNLAVAIAHKLSNLGIKAEIVNADAMQLYRGMDIGTAKLPVSERAGFEHHLIDVLDVRDESTAANYQALAREKILELQSKQIMPILVGGSMLYIAACLNNFDFPSRDERLRQELEDELDFFGPIHMHKKLLEIDPIAASRIIPENGRRVVRALEIVMLTGEPFAASLPEEVQSWQPVLEIGLQMERTQLLPRLESRVAKMWEQGLVDEAKELEKFGLREGKTSSVAIGYAQALAQLDGELSEADAIADTVRLTQRYARRQVSWFKRDSRINWLDATDASLIDKAMKLIQNDGLIA